MEPTSTPVETIAEKVPANLSKAELVNLMMDVIDSMMSECDKQSIGYNKMITAAQSRWAAVHDKDVYSCGVVYKKLHAGMDNTNG